MHTLHLPTPVGCALTLLLAACASAPPQTQPVESGAGAAGATGAAPAAKVRIETADQLPRRAYPIDTAASALFQDDGRFAALAERLEADIRSDLATYDIRDKATLRGYYATLSNLALERGDFDLAVVYRDSVRANEDKPGVRMVNAILVRAMAEASRAPVDRFEAAFSESLRRQVESLPYRQVQTELANWKTNMEMISPNVAIGLAKAQIDPAVQGGEISMNLASQIVGMRTTLDRIVPVRQAIIDVLGETIAANAVEKPDIWPARAVSLEGRSDLAPVTIAIWDTGVDPDLFPGQLYTNPAETPGNGQDDDDNGFIDDVHGIAYDLMWERATGALQPVDYAPAEVGELQKEWKGSSDIQAGIDSPEAQALREKLAMPDSFQAFLEAGSQYGEYAHGTHVAGIAVQGNPAVRLLIARISFDPRSVPQIPTMELAHNAARSFRETVQYFQRHGVRAANMSWEWTPGELEAALEANNAGGSPDERRQLARQMFDVMADGFRQAIASAHGILFVAVAGNSDANNRFVESIPGIFDLPNLITVGAVDQAGEEWAFTSYGKVEVYANGVAVPSVVPGGNKLPGSGTSMAAPQVVNLAAKLLALKPDLTVAELRQAILEGADVKTIGENRTIRLLNPKASLERVQGSDPSGPPEPR